MFASRICNRYVVRPAASTLDFEAKSSVHPVRGRARDLTGYVDACREGATLVLEPPPTMHVEFPVEGLTSGNPLQDREMWKLLDSKRNRLVRADLRGLRSSESNTHTESDVNANSYAVAFVANGEITLCGRSRGYEGTLGIACDDAGLTIDGSLRLDIRDFGITPPRLLVFTVRPDVAIRLHLVATPE